MTTDAAPQPMMPGPVIPEVGVPVQRSPLTAEPPVRHKFPSAIDGLDGPPPPPWKVAKKTVKAAPKNATAATPAAATAAVDTLLGAGLHLLPLRKGEKSPVAAGWPAAAPLTRDKAISHVESGGGIGVNVGQSNIIILDAENAMATRLLREMGFTPDVETANGQVPDGPKFGGTHIYLRVPEGAPEAMLRTPPSIDLDGHGAAMDYLAGARYAVAPPTALAEAGGRRYRIIDGSPLATGQPIPEAPSWLFDATLPAPTAAAETLRRTVWERTAPKPSREPNEAADELTQAINSIPWDVWLEADPRLTDTGVTDECGCSIYHWYAADNPKSATLHDGCARPSGIHIWSGTMQAELSIGEHLSRLQLAEALHGRSTREAAEAVGLELGHGGGELHVIDPEELEDTAARLEAAGDAAAAGRYRAAAATMRRDAELRFGAVAEPTFRVSGGPTVNGAAPTADGDGDGDGDGDADGGGDGDGDTALAERFAELPDPYSIELETAVFDFLPETKAIREAARAGAISPWSVLGITVGRGLLRVAPSVVIPALVGNRPAPLNLQIGIVGRSGAGKGIAESVIDYVASASQDWDKKHRPPSGPALANIFVAKVKGEDGEWRIEQVREAAWCDWSEVDTLTASVKRSGNDLGSELRVAISGAELGSDPKGEGQLPLKVDPMSYRILVSVSVQYGEPAAPLMAERDGGTLQRTVWFGTADPRRLTKRPRGAARWTQLDILHQLPPGQQHLTVDDDIEDEVWEAQSASIDSDTAGDELGGHRNLNRLKIAAWAALVQQHSHIGAAEWEWAGAVMEHSERIRARLDASVRNLKVTEAREAGTLDFERVSAKGAAADVEREAGLAALAAWGQGRARITLSDIKNSVGRSDHPRRRHRRAWADALVEAGVWAGSAESGYRPR